MPTAEEFAALQKALAQATQTSESLAGELRITRAERDLLKEQLNKFKRQLFAAKSEASAGHQKDMFFNEAEALGSATQPAQEETEADDNTVEVPAHKRTKRGRKPLDPALPREVVRHELPESERVCPHDGAVLREYACPCCDGTLRLAAKPEQVIPKGLFSEGLLAWVITSKYVDGLPLYRQAALLGRFGGRDLSRNTMAASVVRVGQAVQPVINLLRDRVLDAPLIFGDETEIQVLKEAGRSAQSKSYMWAQMTDGSGASGTGPPIRLFAYSPSRSTEAAQLLYVGAREGGVLMTDGYEVYNKIALANKLVQIGCWAHCRRYFNDALQALPKANRGAEQLAARFIALIGKLYRVEALAKEQGLDANALLHSRQANSVPVLQEIQALLLANVHAVLPGSLLGKALHYLSSQWAKLERFVTSGNYPIDNNGCENSIRPFVIGRRNWLFADTVAGANASANLYSLLETCKVNGVDGYQYLRSLLVALPRARTVDDYEALLPWRLAR